MHTQYGEDSLRVLDLISNQVKTLTSGSSITELSWSPDGKRLVAELTIGFDAHIVALNLADGKSEQLADAGFWSPRPQFSADGKTLFYSANEGGVGNLYRIALAKNAKAEQITQLTRHLSDARISPDR